ncbi:MAG: DUF4258 domain-containing protein [Microcystaceae cyanobacterium]
MKEIPFSQHSLDKIEILDHHGMTITEQFIIEAVINPDKIENQEDTKTLAQKNLNENLVIRVIYREFAAFILIITLYPARRTRYEKNDL